MEEEEVIKGVFDVLKVSEELKRLKEMIYFMRFKPWEWFNRDEAFKRSLLNEIDKHIAREVEQAMMLTLYEERPKKVVELVKRVVEDYLKKWELDDQIAMQLVMSTITTPEVISRVVQIVEPSLARKLFDALLREHSKAVEQAVQHALSSRFDKLKIDEVENLLKEYEVLDKESGD